LFKKETKANQQFEEDKDKLMNKLYEQLGSINIVNLTDIVDDFSEGRVILGYTSFFVYLQRLLKIT